MVVDVNPFLAELLGYSREAFLGKEIWQLGFFRDIIASQASFTELQEKEYVRYDDKPLRGSDGQRIDVEFVSNVYLVNHQKVIQCNIRDITGRKHAESRVAAFASLGQRLNTARTAREAGEIIVAVADQLLGWDACLFDLYSAAENRMTHLLSMDLIGGQRTECKRPDPVPSPRGVPSRAINQGGQLILRDQPPSIWPEGSPFGDVSRPSASLMFVPIRHGAEVVGVLSIQSYTPKAYDADSLETLQALADHCGGALDRLRMEGALERERHTAQRYLDIAGVMIVAIDPSQNVLLANRKTCEILECGERDLIGHNWFEFAIPKEEQDRLKAGFGDMLVGNIAPWEYVEGAVLTRREEKRLIAWHNTVVRDENSRVIATLSSGEDITNRTALENQLRQAQKMEAVGQLAGGVAHDFNNMLAVIRGNAELLLMDKERCPAEAREGLKHVVEASERAANLTRQLLTFSRKQVLQLQPVLLNTVIANLTKMLHRVLRANIDLQCQYANPLSHVQADTGMIEQVILNLVVNARDAIPEGGQLRVATEQLTLDEPHARANPEARAGEFVCLLVSDTGTGIAPEVLPRIFEPFFTTKDPGKGTGLGLATVYGIVKQHQGWIEVSTRIGEGSTFKVFLPAIATPERLSAAAGVEPVVGGGTETILLVEDEHSVRITTRRVLESKGYTILEAASATEALELWQNHEQEIALLLTDIIMPGKMTGRDLAERLWGQRPGLKVVFMSGYSADVLGKGTDFIRRTRSYFVQKPFSSRAILETVRLCLDEIVSGGRASQNSR